MLEQFIEHSSSNQSNRLTTLLAAMAFLLYEQNPWLVRRCPCYAAVGGCSYLRLLLAYPSLRRSEHERGPRAGRDGRRSPPRATSAELQDDVRKPPYRALFA
jgi:hypothetical protein